MKGRWPNLKSSQLLLVIMIFSQILMAAGPYRLAPQETTYGIPTWAFGRYTKVVVHCNIDGRVEMTAGASSSEINYCHIGRNEYERNFGGFPLAIKNLTSADITVYTE